MEPILGCQRFLGQIQAVLLVLRALAHTSRLSSSSSLLLQTMPLRVRLLGVRPRTGQTLAKDQSPDSGRVWASVSQRGPHHGNGEKRAFPVLDTVALGPRPIEYPLSHVCGLDHQPRGNSVKTRTLPLRHYRLGCRFCCLIGVCKKPCALGCQASQF